MEPMQHDARRHVHVQAGRPTAVLRNLDKSIAQRHLLLVHPLSLVAHHKGRVALERFPLHILGTGIDLHSHYSYRPPLLSVTRTGTRFSYLIIVFSADRFDMGYALVQPIEPDNVHLTVSHHRPELVGQVRAAAAFGCRKVELLLPGDEYCRTAKCRRQQEEGSDVGLLGYVGDDEVALGFVVVVAAVVVVIVAALASWLLLAVAAAAGVDVGRRF